MPLVLTPEASRRVTNGIPLGCPLFLPVHAVNCVQTRKASFGFFLLPTLKALVGHNRDEAAVHLLMFVWMVCFGEWGVRYLIPPEQDGAKHQAKHQPPPNDTIA